MSKIFAGLNEINDILITRNINGVIKVVGIKADHISSQSLYIQNTTNMQGVVNAPGGLAGSTPMQDGDVNTPSLTFKSDPTTGLYKNPSGISIVSGGSSLMDINPDGIVFHAPIDLSATSFTTLSANEITTDSGNLSLNPAGNSIDFNGKNIINIGSVAMNPHYYTVVGAEIITTNTTPVTIVNIPTVNNTVGLISYDLISINGENNDTASYRGGARYKNIGGVTTLSALSGESKFADISLADSDVQINMSGINLMVQCVGLLNKNIKWSGAAHVNVQSSVFIV